MKLRALVRIHCRTAEPPPVDTRHAIDQHAHRCGNRLGEVLSMRAESRVEMWSIDEADGQSACSLNVNVN